MKIRSALLPAFTIVFLVAASALAEGPAPAGDRLTVEMIFGDDPVTGEPPSGFCWSPDGTMAGYLLEVDGETELLAVDLASGKPHRLARTVPATGDAEASPHLLTGLTALHWAPDGRRLALETGSGLFLLQRASGELKRLTDGEGEESDPQFSPDGARLALVRDGDLYVIDIDSGDERRLTADGGGPVINGAADWVHREELDIDSGYCWSPDSGRIAFMRFDQAGVRQWPLMNYEDEDPAVTLQYYPRPGEPNAVVRVGVADVDGSGEPVWIDPGRGADGEWYLARLAWLPAGDTLVLQRLSRDQRRLELLSVPIDGGEPATLLEETDPHWVNLADDLRFHGDGGFLWSSERDGWRHLYRCPAGGGEPKQLTAGPWPVDEVVGLDEKNGQVYFTAGEKSLLERHLYRTGLDGGGLTRLTRAPGWHTITMAPGCGAYVDKHCTAHRPPRFTLQRADGALLGNIHEGAGSALRRYRLRPPEFVEIIAEDGARLPGALLLPPNLDRSKKHPVLVYTYGGPHAQIVRDAWRTTSPWLQMMAQRGFVVFWMDNRGSARRGAAWERAVAERLGEQELQDQLAGLAWLRALPFVDPERIGIYGWSYGGTMVLNAMLRSPGAYAAGAAVAPVTHWREYDTIYTERYMGRPSENERNYKVTAPVNHAERLEGALLLAHGTADDNVHFRNTAKMVRALVDAGKPYELAIYPGKGHSILGPVNRTHIFGRLTRFFEETLEPGRTGDGEGGE